MTKMIIEVTKPEFILAEAFSEHKDSIELHAICKELILEGYSNTEQLADIVSAELQKLDEDDQYEEELLTIGDMLDGYCSKRWSLTNLR